jgi:squalene-hopene/tetraprenyl-beta-curcumene cyclase
LYDFYFVEGWFLWYDSGSMKRLFLIGWALLAVPLMALRPETEVAARSALDKGFQWLREAQSADGSWSDKRFPGMSALALWAMANANLPTNTEAAQKAEAYLVACAQPDGGIYVPIPGRRGGGLGNYNTCLCLTALHAAGAGARHTSTLLAARAYIASTQIETAGLHEGGFGYDKKSPREYTDLNNTFYALDAMRRTQDLEEARPAGEKKVTVDWDAAKRYVLSMQQTEGEDAGGFVYNREVPRAGKDGKVPQLKAYGSMTYAGLLAMLHCELSRDDPRVRSVYKYIGQHWTLEENPGQGNQGLYFYYDVLARALDAAGFQQVELADGTMVDWKEALAEALIRRQQADGSWANENNRFWEADPALSTSYALLALTLILD